MRALEAIERLRGPAALSAIAAEAGMSPSTTHRYLVSLARVGLVEQGARTSLYDLGPAARRLGTEAIRRSDEVSAATAHAVSLRDGTGHTVNICVWTDGGPTVMRWEYGRYPLPIIARVGSTLPVVDSSVGQVFLTYLPRSVTRSVLRTQQRYRETSAVSADELETIRTRVRAHGIAKTVNGVVPGLVVVAAPAFGPGGALSVVFGCAVLARLARTSELNRVQQDLKRTADAFSRELGGPTAAELR